MAKEVYNQLEVFDSKKGKEDKPVKCLGLTFGSNEARRAYFTEELRKKLPELKKIEGFPVGKDEDILELSDPPYYTICPNPFISDIIKYWENEKEEVYGDADDNYHKEPFAADVSEGKREPIYNAHTYHTKVPHKAIMRYLLHYTKPGDIIFDGFCGTGMAGVAAQLCGNEVEIRGLGYIVRGGDVFDSDGNKISTIGSRKAIVNDLSPQATFISYVFNNPFDVKEFEREALTILTKVENEYSWLYKTLHKDGIYGTISNVVWSDVFTCPECSSEIVFLEQASDSESGKVNKEFKCKNCGASLSKTALERVHVAIYDKALKQTIRNAKQIPVFIEYYVGKEKYTKKPDKHDEDLFKKIEETDIEDWYPHDSLPDGYNTRQPMRSHGFMNVNNFYSKRTLIILSRINKYFRASKYRSQLLLLFSSQLINISKLNRYRPDVSFPYNPLNGTLYIGSQICEANVFDALNNKIKRFVNAFNIQTRNVVTSCCSLTDYNIEEDSIDYIFTDPPFGGNIMYSELSFLWESWLKVMTKNNSEAIINPVQNKGLMQYYDLMEKCFKIYYKALKPGRWMTVEFSNSQASVWNAIQGAIQRAGFIISNVSVLDKQQLSFKAVTTTVAVKQDLVISAYKPTVEMQKAIISNQNSVDSAWVFIRNHLEQLPIFIGEKGAADVIVERTPRVLFDRMVAYHVQNGYSVPISSAEFQAGVAQRFPMRDGMVFLENQVAEYDKKRILAKEFLQMSLFVSDENSAIEWLRQQLLKKPQVRQDLHPGFMIEIQHISKFEMMPELDILLEQNFLKYDGAGPVPSQIHGYLSTNFKDLRELDKEDQRLQQKAKDRWYVPDPNKQADLEMLREKSLLREFVSYIDEINKTKKKLKQFRIEAIRAGFKKAWADKDFKTIVDVGSKIPENVLQEDDKLLMYYDNAQIRLGI